MGYARSNVVSIYGDSGNSSQQEPFSSAQLANITAAVKSIATMHLTILLRSMFSKLDDALFELSDGSGNENMKSLYCDEIHELRLKHKQIELIFIKRFEALFSQTLLLSAPVPSAALNKSVFQDILTVNEDELESSIMLTHFVAKAHKSYQNELAFMQAGFDSIIGGSGTLGHAARARRNPVSPTMIGDAFRVAAESLNKNNIHKTMLYDYFDREVMYKLDDIYGQINDLFVKVGAISH